MAAKITTIIPARNFETIRDKVGEIIAVELLNQSDLAKADTRDAQNNIVKQYDETIKPDVYVERFIPIATEEQRVVVVYLDGTSFDQQTTTTQKGKTRLFIDVYCKGQATSEKDGYLSVSQNLQKLAGLIHAIISHPEYTDLGLTGIFNREISDIEYDKGERNDSEYSRVAHITMSVTHIEECIAEQPKVAAGYDTTVKLELTNKGYKFIYNNPTT